MLYTPCSYLAYVSIVVQYLLLGIINHVELAMLEDSYRYKCWDYDVGFL